MPSSSASELHNRRHFLPMLCTWKSGASEVPSHLHCTVELREKKHMCLLVPSHLQSQSWLPALLPLTESDRPSMASRRWATTKASLSSGTCQKDNLQATLVSHLNKALGTGMHVLYMRLQWLLSAQQGRTAWLLGF